MNRIVREHDPVANLPADLRPDLIDTHVGVVIEREMSDGELRADFEREIVVGLAGLEAGRVHGETETEGFIEARFERPPESR